MYTSNNLIFNEQVAQDCPIKCTTFLFELENTVSQWALKLNSAPAAAENWHLHGHMLKVKKNILFKSSFIQQGDLSGALQ
jgi:hypothetical protein